MKTLRVVAAVICDSIEHKTKIFSTARGYGEFKGGWNSPAGRSKPERPRSRQLSERSVRSWMPQSRSET